MAGALGTAATVLFFSNQFLGLGVIERLAVYPMAMWAIGIGVVGYRRRSAY